MQSGIWRGDNPTTEVNSGQMINLFKTDGNPVHDKYEWLSSVLDDVYTVGYDQALAHASGGGANTRTSDGLYKAKAAIIKQLQEAETKARISEIENLDNAREQWEDDSQVYHYIDARLATLKQHSGK